jgi:hypothetical protein
MVLEGISHDRAAKLSAHTALAQMLGEMREDRGDIDEIRELQFERNSQYLAIDEWLASPETMPLDSMAEAIDATFLETAPSIRDARHGLRWLQRGN